ECVVMPAEEQSCSSSCVSLKLQSRDRSSSQLFLVHRVRTPLPLCFLIFILCAVASVRFHFDGSKVAGSQTAAQLELEDGDIIERMKQTGSNFHFH
uniref:Rad60/SUMO-like domain-containing protein n=1 Tax=Poecilia mexicana TaxID=48701 RepID=A0A3B3YBL1_9TELE